ncbi:MAG: hypothetical protein LUD54_03545 [Oscillospiraceae bacterium]|nr:hypothetical protein [Oscillospiraceae bacterium]
MKIAQIYSHLNGLEYLIVHKNNLLQEIKSAIQNVDASETFDKVSKEKTMVGKILYSPTKLNELFKSEFSKNGWAESRITYFVSADLQTTRAVVDTQDYERQKQEILNRGFRPFRTYNQVDFVKDKTAV